LVASFIKKLIRLSLLSPPNACVFIIALCYNLILFHSELKCLIHSKGLFYFNNIIDENNSENYGILLLDDNQNDEEKTEIWKGIDPFLFNETNPKNTNAIESTLWEIETLKNHYHPLVSKMAFLFEKNFKEKKSGFKISDLLDISYSKIFDENLKSDEKSSVSNEIKRRKLFHNNESQFSYFDFVKYSN
jgi:U3 small nucleolar RNA-associated protein 19